MPPAKRSSQIGQILLWGHQQRDLQLDPDHGGVRSDAPFLYPFHPSPPPPAQKKRRVNPALKSAYLARRPADDSRFGRLGVPAMGAP